MRIYQILMLLDWIKKMKRIKKYKLLMLKLYSVFLLIVVCFCIFLSIYWYIKPRTNDVGENHIYSEEFVNSDTIKLYDNLEFQMKTTLNVSKVANIGVYSSRLDDADKDSKVKMVLQEKGMAKFNRLLGSFVACAAMLGGISSPVSAADINIIPIFFLRLRKASE